MIDFKVVGGERVTIAYLKAAKGLRDYRPAFKAAKPDAQQSFTDVFDSEGSAGGGAWPKLSAAYAARKGGGQIGVLSGRMRAGFTGRIRVTANKKSVRYGSSHVAAKTFSFGWRKRNQPARMLAVWSKAGEDGLFKAVDDYTAKVLQAFGSIGRGR